MPHDAALDQPPEVRHAAGVEERVDQPPVGGLQPHLLGQFALGAVQRILAVRRAAFGAQSRTARRRTVARYSADISTVNPAPTARAMWYSLCHTMIPSVNRMNAIANSCP